MPSLDDVHADLEADRRSREAEIRLVERLSASASTAEEQSMLRRSLILLTYAHVEGFAKFSLLAYASKINSCQINCGEAAVPVAAASLSKVFASLRNPQSKHDFFRRRLPDDAKLHMLAREHVFVGEFEAVRQMRVDISDDVIDTQSNLTPDVLRKLLFQLGLSYSEVDAHQGPMSRLLGMRNHIAHGDRLKVPSVAEAKEFIEVTVAVMSFLHQHVYDALLREGYRRPPET